MTGLQLVHQIMALGPAALGAQVYIDLVDEDGFYHSSLIESISFDGSDSTVSLSGGYSND